MKNTILYTLLGCCFILLIQACKKETPDVWMSSTTTFDGNWQVRYDYTFSGDEYTGFADNLTYNTSSNSGDSIWLESTKNGLKYKVRVPINPQELTFGTQDTLFDIVDSVKFIVKEGKIIKDAYKAPSGLLVDSIYYKVWFEGFTPNDEISIGGYRQTGFPEDDIDN